MSFSKLNNLIKSITVIILVCMYLFLGTYNLNIDVINPDGINWHTRTQGFSEALVKKDYGATFQAYHPGTTLMWISGPILSIFKPTIGQSNQDAKSSFLQSDYYSKLSVVLFGTLIFGITFVLLWKLVSFKYSLFYSIIFTLEPFIIGMRRLYHLDFIMSILLFLCIILLIYFNYKTSKWYLPVLAGLTFSLSVLTKSTALILLPVIPFIFILGNCSLIKKAQGLGIFIISTLIFIYCLFPPIWGNPIKYGPTYFKQIAFGISDIGVEGKKEIGTSGKSDNVTLEDTIKDRNPNFYISALFIRLTPVSDLLLVASLGLFVYRWLKGFGMFIWKSIKSKHILKDFSFSVEGWLSFWSLGISIAVLIALTIAVKKSDRYEILVFPFLITLISYLLTKLKLFLSLPVILIYISLVSRELIQWQPYFLAYSNPLLGGIETRLRVIDDAPFGIGSYSAFEIVKKDREDSNYPGYYTISGSKSIKAISVGGKFSRYPSCVTDYVISYALDDQPIYSCVQKFTKIGSVKIGGFDYWNIYKRNSQRHESNYE